jgi:hypothetical protein
MGMLLNVVRPLRVSQGHSLSTTRKKFAPRKLSSSVLAKRAAVAGEHEKHCLFITVTFGTGIAEHPALGCPARARQSRDKTDEQGESDLDFGMAPGG